MGKFSISLIVIITFSILLVNNLNKIDKLDAVRPSEVSNQLTASLRRSTRVVLHGSIIIYSISFDLIFEAEILHFSFLLAIRNSCLYIVLTRLKDLMIGVKNVHVSYLPGARVVRSVRVYGGAGGRSLFQSTLKPDGGGVATDGVAYQVLRMTVITSTDNITSFPINTSSLVIFYSLDVLLIRPSDLHQTLFRPGTH